MLKVMKYYIILSAMLFLTACDTNTTAITVIGEESANIQAIRALKSKYDSRYSRLYV